MRPKDVPAGEELSPARPLHSPSVLTANRGAPIFAVLGIVALGVTLYLLAPGYMSRDSGVQLEQARSFQLTDDHPVLMALIWRYTDRILPGPLGLLVLMCTLYWAGLSVLFWSLSGPPLARAVGMVVVGSFPPVFSIVPVVWKDTLMQAALLAALACVVFPVRRGRITRDGLATAFFLVAIGARHNAAAAVWPLLAFPLLQLPVLVREPPWLRLLSACIVALALTVGLTLALARVLDPLATATEYWQTVPIFDLAGMSVRTGQVLVEPESGVLTPGMGVDDIRRVYRSTWHNELYDCIEREEEGCVPVFRRTIDSSELAHLSDNWRRALLKHPSAYLAHRLAVGRALLNISGGPTSIYYLEDQPHHPLARDYPPAPRTIALLAWTDARVTSIWFRPWVYLLICCLLLPVSAARYMSGRSALPLLCALSGLAHILGVLLTTGSPEYRYTVWMILCALLALMTLFMAPRAGRLEPGGALLLPVLPRLS